MEVHEPAKTVNLNFLRCPGCGETGHLSVPLSSEGDVVVLYCTECGDEFDRDTIASTVEAWQAVLAWIALRPVCEE